jgi:uncharacterized protein (DUF1800 family)
MRGPSNPWAPFEPTAADRWDLHKVAHLHRRAGFGATWAELQRDVRAGPAACVERLLNATALSTEQQQVLDSLLAAIGESEDRLKASWMYRIVFGLDPLREKMTLFWHSHFATSNRKVKNLTSMLEQNELLRRHALGNFAELLGAMAADPAMLIWLDGGSSRRERPNENFAREFLELFTVGKRNYSEADVRQAARAFTGWVPEHDNGRGEPPRFRFDPDSFDDGDKVFLGQRGRWSARDIIRITLAQAAAAEFVCRKLFRLFIREDSEPSVDLIRPLAAELSANRFSIRHVVSIILRSRLFYEPSVIRQCVKSPVEFSAGLVRMLEIPRAKVRLLALAATGDRQGQELFYPPNVGGWPGGRCWLNSASLLERGNWCSDLVWGNANLDMPPFDPLAWAAGNDIPATHAAAALLELLLQGNLDNGDRQLILRTASGGGANACRQALQLMLHCSEFQLA